LGLTPPVENPVDEKILAEEAEQALKSTGEKSTGVSDNLPSVEFYYGKVRQNGHWIKTGKIYWIYTTYQNGQRKRVSPSRIYRNERRITSIDNCPYEGRILEFRSRSLGFKYTGGTDGNGRLSDSQEGTSEKLASQQ
jgi:hypothetical protein